MLAAWSYQSGISTDNCSLSADLSCRGTKTLGDVAKKNGERFEKSRRTRKTCPSSPLSCVNQGFPFARRTPRLYEASHFLKLQHLMEMECFKVSQAQNPVTVHRVLALACSS